MRIRVIAEADFVKPLKPNSPIGLGFGARGNYQPRPDNTIVVVEITNPVIDGADLIYSYKIINGKMPAGGCATALFIDWIGVGGGVGPGFHGIGVGRRGPGVL